MNILKRIIIIIHQINKLDKEQFEIFIKIFHNTINALNRGKAFATVVAGGAGTGKSRILIEILIALVRSDQFSKKNVKILVTGSTDNDVNELASIIHTIRAREKAGKFL